LKREHYHWHLEILPRLSKIAGFELASGYHINTVAPEVAARQLRDIAL
jgi:UDPglucose--hexose-1-phosphate uridylyltransferase